MSDFVFINRLALIIKFEFVLRPSHAEDFKAIDLWNKLGWAFREQLWELFEENVREGRAEVSTVDVQLLLSGNVDVLAARTIHFYSGSGKFFADSNRKHVVPFAKYSWAV